MKIILLASATAGHVLPLIAIYRQYQKRRIEVCIVAEDKTIPHKLLEKIEDAIFIKPIISLKSYNEGVKQLSKYNKDSVFLSLGGRVSVLLPGLYLKGYRRLFIYELNMIMGRSNKIAKPFVKETFSYFPLKGKNISLIGHPLDDEKHANIIKKDGKRILVLTGSNGSEDLFRIFDEMKLRHGDLDLTISQGYQKYKFKSAVKVIGFIKTKDYQNYDLILARCGAGTIVDVLRHYVPVIFLPSPNVKDNHQKKNAEFLYENLGITYLNYAEQKQDFYRLIQQELQYERRKNLVSKYNMFQSCQVFINMNRIIFDEDSK